MLGKEEGRGERERERETEREMKGGKKREVLTSLQRPVNLVDNHIPFCVTFSS